MLINTYQHVAFTELATAAGELMSFRKVTYATSPELFALCAQA